MKIERALDFYLRARDAWKDKIDGDESASEDLHLYWAEGAAAVREASQYIQASRFARAMAVSGGKAESDAVPGRAEENPAETPVPPRVAAATPAPAPGPTPVHYRYFLTQEVKIKTNYGTIAVPAHTEVALVQLGSSAMIVKAMGNEFQVVPSQLTRVAY